MAKFIAWLVKLTAQHQAGVLSVHRAVPLLPLPVVLLALGVGLSSH